MEVHQFKSGCQGICMKFINLGSLNRLKQTISDPWLFFDYHIYIHISMSDKDGSVCKATPHQIWMAYTTHLW